MTIDFDENVFKWEVGEAIKIFKTYTFTRIEWPEKGGGYGVLIPVFEPINTIMMMAKRAKADEIDATSTIRKEAKILLMLPPHANVLESFIVQKIKGTYHIFTEYIDGGNLDQLIKLNRSCPPGWTEIYNMIYQIIRGMSFLHSQDPPIVHRDLKPQNILLKKVNSNKYDDIPILKIADFGLSKLLTDPLVPENPGKIHESIGAYKSVSGGTDGYTSPEQAHSIKVDEIGNQSDIFAFGIVIIELITSRTDFKDKINYFLILPKGISLSLNNLYTQERVLQSRIDKFIDTDRSDTPKELRDLIKKCLRINTADRYQSFEEVQEALNLIVQNYGTNDLLVKIEAKLVNHTPTFFPLLFYELRALSLRSLGLITESNEVLDIASKLPCKDFRDFYTKGRIFSHLGKYGEAIYHFDKAIDLNPNNINIYLNKGYIYIRLKHPDKAIEVYDKALEIDPNNVDSISFMAKALYNLGSHEKSLDSCKKAIDLDQTNPYSYCVKALILSDNGKTQDALEVCKQAIDLEENDPFPHDTMGNILDSTGQYEEAIKEFDKALEIDPSYVDSYYNKGNALASTGQYEEAIKEFDKALEIDPNDVDCWCNKGNSLHDMGQHEEAIMMYDKALEINPSYEKSYYNKGIVFASMGQHEEAIMMYDKALEIDPNNLDYYNNKGVSYSALGDKKKAIDEYDKALLRNPNFVKALINKGNALRLLRKYEEATETYCKVIDIDSKNIKAYVRKGICLAKLSQHEKAIMMYDKALEIIPNNEEILGYKKDSLDKIR